MSRWSADPEASAFRLMQAVLPRLELSGKILLANDHADVARSLRDAGFEVEAWNRRAGGTSPAAPEPPHGPFDGALLRLPKVKAELEMAAHQTLSRVRDDGRLVIYGGNDEGARTIAKRLEALDPEIETLASEAHGRVVAVRRRQGVALRAGIADWKQTGSIDLGGSQRCWVSYPGLFADGALDDATALLLSHLPPLPAAARVLDFGCGTGVISAAIHDRHPDAEIAALDIDSLALEAVRENVPTASRLIGSNLDPAPVKLDLIVSNPPIHDGIAESLDVIQALIKRAPKLLRRNGRLMLVVQRRIPLQHDFAAAFKSVDIVADDGRFRVWSAAL